MDWKEKHKEMVLRLKKPGKAILETLTPDDCDLIHMLGCLMGEAAELYDAVLDKSDEILEELGDFEFYLVAARAVFGLSPEIPFTSFADRADAIDACVKLMRQSGHLWDVVKRVTVYRKDLHASDKKFDGKSLNDVGVAMVREIEDKFYSLVHFLGYEVDQVRSANWDKLADTDKGRYASGSYSDAQAQDRRDKA